MRKTVDEKFLEDAGYLTFNQLLASNMLAAGENRPIRECGDERVIRAGRDPDTAICKTVMELKARAYDELREIMPTSVQNLIHEAGVHHLIQTNSSLWKFLTALFKIVRT